MTTDGDLGMSEELDGFDSDTAEWYLRRGEEHLRSAVEQDRKALVSHRPGPHRQRAAELWVRAGVYFAAAAVAPHEAPVRSGDWLIGDGISRLNREYTAGPESLPNPVFLGACRRAFDESLPWEERLKARELATHLLNDGTSDVEVAREVAEHAEGRVNARQRWQIVGAFPPPTGAPLTEACPKCGGGLPCKPLTGWTSGVDRRREVFDLMAWSRGWHCVNRGDQS